LNQNNLGRNLPQTPKGDFIRICLFRIKNPYNTYSWDYKSQRQTPTFSLYINISAKTGNPNNQSFYFINKYAMDQTTLK